MLMRVGTASQANWFSLPNKLTRIAFRPDVISLPERTATPAPHASGVGAITTLGRQAHLLKKLGVSRVIAQIFE